MDALTTARTDTALVPLTGRRRDWARDAGLVGLVTGFSGPAWIVYGLTPHPHLIACALSAGVLGAALGFVGPDVFGWLRQRVSLKVLAVALPAAAFFLGWGAASLAAGAVGAPAGAAAWFGGVALAGQVTLFWLPYLVAVVTRLPRWPVVVAACLLSPLMGYAAWILAMVL